MIRGIVRINHLASLERHTIQAFQSALKSSTPGLRFSLNQIRGFSRISLVLPTIIASISSQWHVALLAITATVCLESVSIIYHQWNPGKNEPYLKSWFNRGVPDAKIRWEMSMIYRKSSAHSLSIFYLGCKRAGTDVEFSKVVKRPKSRENSKEIPLCIRKRIIRYRRDQDLYTIRYWSILRLSNTMTIAASERSEFVDGSLPSE